MVKLEMSYKNGSRKLRVLFFFSSNKRDFFLAHIRTLIFQKLLKGFFFSSEYCNFMLRRCFVFLFQDNFSPVNTNFILKLVVLHIFSECHAILLKKVEYFDSTYYT